jgi:hypothetical protein
MSHTESLPFVVPVEISNENDYIVLFGSLEGFHGPDIYSVVKTMDILFEDVPASKKITDELIKVNKYTNKDIISLVIRLTIIVAFLITFGFTYFKYLYPLFWK